MKLKSFYLAPDASVCREEMESMLLDLSLTVPDATGDETYNDFFNEN